MIEPTARQLSNGTFKKVNGIWYQRCTGPAHEEPEYLPATDKYFYIHKSGERKGQLTRRCRLCNNWGRLTTARQHPGSLHGWVPLHECLHFFLEAVNRVGARELADRAGISYNTLTPILMGRSKYVRKVTLRKVMLELISMRRKNEYSISKHARWRVARRARGATGCAGCGTALSNITEGCSSCWERHYRRDRRSS